jgi:hypothetical protein
MRLQVRVLAAYPRAFQWLLADGRYAQAPFLNLWLDHGKHTRVILKDEQRDLYQDARGLFQVTAPQEGKYRSRHCRGWEVSDLTTWPQVKAPLRVIRWQEIYWGRRRGDIENYGFNELAHEWHSDHGDKHDAKARETFLLMPFWLPIFFTLSGFSI